MKSNYTPTISKEKRVWKTLPYIWGFPYVLTCNVQSKKKLFCPVSLLPASNQIGSLKPLFYWNCGAGPYSWQVSSVQSLSCIWLFATPCIAVRQASLSITNSRSLPKPMSTVSVMPSKHLILCHPLLLLSSIFPSIRVFSNESAVHIRWPKYWSFSFNISPSNEQEFVIWARGVKTQSCDSGCTCLSPHRTGTLYCSQGPAHAWSSGNAG